MIFSHGQIARNYQFGANDRLPSMNSPRGEYPIELRSLNIKVAVTGHFAQTTQIMCFYNPNNRNLEGDLTFPLPDNVTVCGYALDIGGVLVDGVIVPKQEARKILETEIRKGIDPGLIEQTQGNVYKTRIYPIPPQGTRTVSITYTSDLVFTGKDAAYHLPLTHAENLDEVFLRIEVQQSPVLPEINGGQGNVSLIAWKNMWVAEAKLSRGIPTEDLQIRLPNLPDSFTMVETTQENETFFCVSNLLEKEKDRDPWQAKRIAIAWDASGSRSNINRDLDLLKVLFSQWQNLTVDLRVFSNCVNDTCPVFEVNKGKADELFRFLRQMPYDGATGLSALDFTVLPYQETEAWLLFTDGLMTLNKDLPTIGGTKIFTIVSQPQNNTAFMQYLADQTGGKYINLLRTHPEKACEEIVFHKGGSTAVEIQGCEDVAVKEFDGRQIITGKLVNDVGSFKEASSGNKLEISMQDSGKGEILARQWAGQKIQQLSLTQCHDVLNLARKYGVVSPETSLLVLENIDQYLEYGIAPPASRFAMLAEYQERQLVIEKESDMVRSEHLETVVSLWQRRVEWWQKKFTPKSKKGVPARRERPRSSMSSSADGACYSINRERFSDSESEIDACPDFELDPCCPNFAYDSSDTVLSENCGNGDFTSAEIAVGTNSMGATTTIKPWSPDTPYLNKLRSSNQEEAYTEYLSQRKEYALSPAFFFDCGAFFLSNNERQLGLRVLSNLMEMNLEDVGLMRMYAWRLQQAGELDQAIAVFESVLALRDDEPQSHRDLALALSDRWAKTGQKDDILRAMDLLYTVALQEWERFPEIEIIALMELNRLINLAKLSQIKVPGHFDSRLIKLLDLDIRISMSWDADLTDIDLHVFEPTGEHANFAHQLTEIGGLVSRDFRDGYGPEEYVLRRAVPGVYKIKAHYYGSHQQTVCGPCTVTVNVFTNYGRSDEVKQVLTLRLEESGHDIMVGEVAIQDNHKRSADTDDAFSRNAKNLQKGMSVDQVTKLLGQPHRVRTENDDKAIVLTYVLPDKMEIHIALGPELVWARRIMAGAEVEIVI